MGQRIRRLRHESWGLRHAVLELETSKWCCRQSGHSFWQRSPGILTRKRATEPFRRSVAVKHWDGISRRQAYATTLCDPRHHRVYDVVLGRSEAALEAYFETLPGKAQVRLVCMDLTGNYRALVRKHFPNAHIVADRFHVIRLLNHHFLACWPTCPSAPPRSSSTASSSVSATRC